jgi:hypothetical protein
MPPKRKAGTEAAAPAKAAKADAAPSGDAAVTIEACKS